MSRVQESFERFRSQYLEIYHFQRPREKISAIYRPFLVQAQINIVVDTCANFKVDTIQQVVTFNLASSASKCYLADNLRGEWEKSSGLVEGNKGAFKVKGK